MLLCCKALKCSYATRLKEAPPCYGVALVQQGGNVRKVVVASRQGRSDHDQQGFKAVSGIPRLLQRTLFQASFTAMVRLRGGFSSWHAARPGQQGSSPLLSFLLVCSSSLDGTWTVIVWQQLLLHGLPMGIPIISSGSGMETPEISARWSLSTPSGKLRYSGNSLSSFHDHSPTMTLHGEATGIAIE